MDFGTPYQSLVAIILSARTRDEQVLKLMPGFLKVFPTVDKLAKASEVKIQSKINTIGMYKQKSKNLKKMAQRVVDVYEGEIPDSMDELVTLAGVGRKTASVLLPSKFGKPAIAVDTHVHRVTNRLGWVKTSTPAKTEEELLKIIPIKNQKATNEVFVKHGRYICISKPRCWACPLSSICTFKDKNLERPKDAEKILEDIERRENELQVLRSRLA